MLLLSCNNHATLRDCLFLIILLLILKHMIKPSPLWLSPEYHLETLTPWETHEVHSFDALRHHRKQLSQAHPHQFRVKDTQSQRSHYSLFKKNPTLESLSPSRNETQHRRYRSITQQKISKHVQADRRSG